LRDYSSSNFSSGLPNACRVVVSLSSDGLKAKLDPFGTKTALLASNTKYKAVVTTGAKDLAGIALAQQKSWTFTTKPQGEAARSDERAGMLPPALSL
jgi:hypothetical protein